MSAEFWANFTLQSYNCFYAIQVWDLLLALKQEKEKIWDRPWDMVKGIYLFNRWYGLAAMTVNLCFYNIHVSRALCNRYVRVEPYSTIPMILAYQSILLIRCSATWSHNKVVLFVALTFMVTQFIVQSYASSKMFPTAIPTDVGPCVVNGDRMLIASYFLLPACTDTILTFLTFARVLYFTRQSKRSKVLTTFLKEGFAFFMIVFIANAANGILYLQNNRDVSTIGSGFAIIMGNVCGNHLILRSRRRAEAIQQEYSFWNGRPISELVPSLNLSCVTAMTGSPTGHGFESPRDCLDLETAAQAVHDKEMEVHCTKPRPVYRHDSEGGDSDGTSMRKEDPVSGTPI